MSDEIIGRGVSVTIKYGKGYEETWAGFRGLPDEVRADIIGYFGIDAEAVQAATLNELVVMVTAQAHGAQAAANRLGAVPINSTTTVETEAPQAAADDLGWDDNNEAGAEAEPAVDPLFAAVEAVTSLDELKTLWAQNQEAFAGGELLDAYKAKGRALKAAAA